MTSSILWAFCLHFLLGRHLEKFTVWANLPCHLFWFSFRLSTTEDEWNKESVCWASRGNQWVIFVVFICATVPQIGIFWINFVALKSSSLVARHCWLIKLALMSFSGRHLRIWTQIAGDCWFLDHHHCCQCPLIWSTSLRPLVSLLLHLLLSIMGYCRPLFLYFRLFNRHSK